MVGFVFAFFCFFNQRRCGRGMPCRYDLRIYFLIRIFAPLKEKVNE